MAVKDFYTQRFYNERRLAHEVGARAAARHNTALELYAGTGGMTSILRPYFNRIVKVDIDPRANADYTTSAVGFCKLFLPTFGPIDLVDFDSYGSASEAVATFMENISEESIPFILIYFDCGALTMKRNPRWDWRKNYRVPPDTSLSTLQSPWRFHKEVCLNMLTRLASRRGWECREMETTIMPRANCLEMVVEIH